MSRSEMTQPVHPLTKEELRLLIREEVTLALDLKFELLGFTSSTDELRVEIRKDQEFIRKLRLSWSDLVTRSLSFIAIAALAGFLALACYGLPYKNGSAH